MEMYAIKPTPAWSALSTNGHKSSPDYEWLYHFSVGGYDDIVHVDIYVNDSFQRELVHSALKRVHVPGEETSEGFRVFGYLQDGQFADFI